MQGVIAHRLDQVPNIRLPPKDCMIQIGGSGKEIGRGCGGVDKKTRNGDLGHAVEHVEFDIEGEIFNRGYTKSVPGVPRLNVKGARHCKKLGSMT